MSQIQRSLKCPSCKNIRLSPVDYKGVEIDVCRSCGGLWFDHSELNQIISGYDNNFNPNHENIPSPLGFAREKNNLMCPCCRSFFTTYQYSPHMKLDFDVCDSCHGIWLEKQQFDFIREAPRAMISRVAIEKSLTLKTRLFQFFTGLPVEFNIKPRSKPVVTLSLLAINILVFIISIMSGHSEFTKEYGMTPTLLKFPGEWWHLLSSMFLHGGIFHLIGNMYFLYILGDNVEEDLGKIKYLGLYFLSGIGAGIFHAIFTSMVEIPIIGASGAVAGVMAAYIVLYRKAFLTFMVLIFQFKISATIYFGIWVLFNFVMAMLYKNAGVAWWAHLGGFAIGASLALLFYDSILEKNHFLQLMNRHMHVIKNRYVPKNLNKYDKNLSESSK